jgi:transposase
MCLRKGLLPKSRIHDLGTSSALVGVAMMGVQTEQKELFNYAIDLDRRVRRDNPLRAIRAQVDFAWVRDDVAHHYGYNGNESVDPAVILKLLFLLFLDNVKSERELMRIVPERLDYLWFLGYSLDDEVPDHSVLSKARARWGRETFERFFVRTVAQCVSLGLIDGKKIHIDSSLVDADAAKTSMVTTSPEMVAALRAAYAVEESKFEIEEDERRTVPKHRVNFSKTDPDATLVARDARSAYASARPRYKSHRVIDDRCGVITAVETTPGHIRDGNCLPAIVEKHHRTSGTAAETVVGDQHYGTRENFRHLQSLGVATHMKPLRSKGMAEKHEVFHVSEFIYDSLSDTFRCPGNQQLTRRGYNKNEQGWYYRADTEICATCSLRSQCTKTAHPAHTRLIVRPDGYELLLKGWAQAAGYGAQRDRCRRMTLVEGSFGQAAQNHHFKRARYRRLWRQAIQDHLIAAVQNVKKMLKYAPPNEGSAQSGASSAWFWALCELIAAVREICRHATVLITGGMLGPSLA